MVQSVSVDECFINCGDDSLMSRKGASALTKYRMRNAVGGRGGSDLVARGIK